MTRSDTEFIADPTGHMIGIIDDRTVAEDVKRHLDEGGFEEVRLYRGSEGVQAIDSGGEEHGLGHHLLRLVQQGLTNKDHLTEYEEAARQGAAVISVRVDTGEGRRERAAEILDRAGAHTVNYFGPAVVETIKP